MTPIDIAVKAEELKERLIVQAADQIDMGDYKQQMRAYQIMLRDLIVLVRENAKSTDVLSTQLAKLLETKT